MGYFDQNVRVREQGGTRWQWDQLKAATLRVAMVGASTFARHQ